MKLWYFIMLIYMHNLFASNYIKNILSYPYIQQDNLLQRSESQWGLNDQQEIEVLRDFLLKDQCRDRTLSDLFPKVLVCAYKSGETLHRRGTLYDSFGGCKIIYGENNIVIMVNKYGLAWQVEEDAIHDVRNYEWNGQGVDVFFKNLAQEIQKYDTNINVKRCSLKKAEKVYLSNSVE